jgi:AcrR family transcriptional regulator
MDTEDGGGLREKKKQRLRDELIAASLVLFEKNGFDATTIDDMARAVGVSRRTFFRYFETKEDVVTAWFEKPRVGLAETLEARPLDEPPLESLRWAFAHVAGTYEAHRAEALVVERIVASTPSLRGHKLARLANHGTVLAEVFARRLGMDPVDDLLPRWLGRVALAAGSSALETWVARGGKGSLRALIDEAMRLLAMGAMPAQTGPAWAPPAARAQSETKKRAAAR